MCHPAPKLDSALQESPGPGTDRNMRPSLEKVQKLGEVPDPTGGFTWSIVAAWAATGVPSPEVIAGSGEFASVFHPAMIAALGADWPDLGIKGDSETFVGSRQGALTGSIFSTIPVVTVEMAVITQPDDEAFISSPEGQDRMARAIFAGLDAWFRSR